MKGNINRMETHLDAAYFTGGQVTEDAGDEGNVPSAKQSESAKRPTKGCGVK